MVTFALSQWIPSTFDLLETIALMVVAGATVHVIHQQRRETRAAVLERCLNRTQHHSYEGDEEQRRWEDTVCENEREVRITRSARVEERRRILSIFEARLEDLA